MAVLEMKPCETLSIGIEMSQHGIGEDPVHITETVGMPNNESGEDSRGEEDTVTVETRASKRSKFEELNDEDTVIVETRANKRSRFEELNDEDTVTVGTMANKSCRFKELNDQLLPGLPNEITLDKIAPKLSWKVFHILSSVSSTWRQAIESRQVHDARVQSHSTETLVVLHHRPSWDREATAELFSTRDNCCYRLPPIPDVDIRTGRGRGHWISLGSKIYAVGPVLDALKRNCVFASTEVYVLDLAGQKEWKKCASMQEERDAFACGAIDGKIYVFGGTLNGYPVYLSEVYDPNEGAWSAIRSMITMRFHHQVATVGEHLVVHGGMYYDPQVLDEYDLPILELGTTADEPVYNAEFLEIYHPIEDEWELIEPFVLPTGSTLVFMAQGKLHRITCDGIDVHDIHQNVWTPLHVHSFASIEELASVEFKPVSILVANGELLLFVYWFTNDLETFATGHTLLQSKGFGNQKKEIVWNKATCSLALETRDPFICSIEL